VIQGAPCGWGAAIFLSVSGKHAPVIEENTERILDGIERFAEHFFFPSLKHFFPSIHPLETAGNRRKMPQIFLRVNGWLRAFIEGWKKREENDRLTA
jgi:hypothetical protein